MMSLEQTAELLASEAPSKILSMTADQIHQTAMEMEDIGSRLLTLERSVNGGISLVLGKDVPKTQ